MLLSIFGVLILTGLVYLSLKDVKMGVVTIVKVSKDKNKVRWQDEGF